MCPPHRSIHMPKAIATRLHSCRSSAVSCFYPALSHITVNSQLLSPLPLSIHHQDHDGIFKAITNSQASFYLRVKCLLPKRMAWIFAWYKGTRLVTCCHDCIGEWNGLIAVKMFFFFLFRNSKCSWVHIHYLYLRSLFCLLAPTCAEQRAVTGWTGSQFIFHATGCL